ncbi:hypothetical protein BKA61DRAFT_491080, partial [Leptodontidium sp. MPI-SDFR-AT-0119]
YLFRSLTYVNKKTEFRQVPILSLDIVVVLLRTATQRILVVLVYVPRDVSASYK